MQIRNAMCAKSALHTAKSALQGQSAHLLLWLFCTKGCKKNRWASSKTWNYQPMLHNIAYARPYGTLTRPQFWLTRQACAWNDVKWLTGSLRWQVWLKMHFITAYARGMKPLTPELAPGMLQKCKDATLRNPVFFAYATQSYDTTMFKVYSRGFWRYSGKPCGSCGPLDFLIHSSHPPLFNLRKMSSSFCSRSPGLDLRKELTFQSETMLIDVACYVLLVK